MKDLHTHLLYGIDDGSKSLEESVKLLKQLTSSGIKEIIVTPHYIEDSKYMCNNKDKKALLEELKKAAIENNIDVKLY